MGRLQGGMAVDKLPPMCPFPHCKISPSPAATLVGKLGGLGQLLPVGHRIQKVHTTAAHSQDQETRVRATPGHCVCTQKVLKLSKDGRGRHSKETNTG